MLRPLFLTAGLLAFTACSSADAAPERTEAPVADASLPTVLVYKTPTCGCCNGWIEHLEQAGFTVDARDVRDLMSIKMDGGVPPGMSSCHTAIIQVRADNTTPD